jgi:hypothetical protein
MACFPQFMRTLGHPFKRNVRACLRVTGVSTPPCEHKKKIGDREHAIRDDHSFYLPLSFLSEDVLLSLWDGCRSQHFITRVQTRVLRNTLSKWLRPKFNSRSRLNIPPCEHPLVLFHHPQLLFGSLLRILSRTRAGKNCDHLECDEAPGSWPLNLA